MLAGDLNEFTLPDLFQLLALTKKSGALRVSHGDTEGRVYFDEGAVYFALSDERRLPLGARLVAGGHLSAERLRELLRAHRGSSPVEVAADLLSTGEVDEETLEQFVREQVHDALFALLRLDSGSFAFDSAAGVDWPGARLSATEALDEAHRRVEEWSRLAADLPAGEAVLALVPNPPGKSPLSLSRDQWHLVTLVDGKRTLSEVVALSGQGEFAGGQLVGELVGTGLLEAHERPGEGALADLLGGRHALRQLEEVALGAEISAPSPAGRSSRATASEEAAEPAPADGEEESALARVWRDDDDVAPASADAGHAGAEAEGDDGDDGGRPGTRTAETASADGSRPRGEVMVLAPASAEDDEEGLPGLHASLTAVEGGDERGADDEADARTRSMFAGPEDEAAESWADDAEDPGAGDVAEAMSGVGDEAAAVEASGGDDATGEDEAGAPSAEDGAPGDDREAAAAADESADAHADTNADTDAHADADTDAEDTDADGDADTDARADDDDKATDSGSRGDRGGGGSGEAAHRRAPARTMDRAQVARELASLGADDTAPKRRTRTSATGGRSANSAGSSSGARPANGARAVGAARSADGGGQRASAQAPADPPAPRTPATAGGDGGRPLSPGATTSAARLTRDEDVNRGLLLRLIDGVKGA